MPKLVQYGICNLWDRILYIIVLPVYIHTDNRSVKRVKSFQLTMDYLY